ncbi:23S rRNA m(2)A-2503 methyltransferase [Syntrophobotulus glycolicus DSM 8271]|uniref:Probable dual-specificity RNA methyltransferase RlmN n=2 Tax=Syntrophobotulus TaxID=51196 RepID=F0SUR2_SYNGF|nr:23S rRNA m(2)A-2503 methyltransferase [Syntrophobotulus glycolicus DSM 8271]
MEKYDCRGLSEPEMEKLCLQNGIKKFRADQVFRWVQQKGVRCWDEMKNIGQEDTDKLKKVFCLQPLEIVKEQVSKDGTRKFLFRLPDGERIETVLMDYEKDLSRNRETVCVSTQVGCPVGCPFCATGVNGFHRNLSAGEITGQVLEIVRRMRINDPSFNVTNIVFMGMGEPFLNEESVLKAVRILNSENGQKIGMRRMTISTSGVVPGIIRLAEENKQVGLAISLHSARNHLRDILVPMNRRYPLQQLMRACREYVNQTGRRVTLEIALTEANANKDEAEALIRLIQGMPVHINLIPVNPVTESSMQRPAKEKIMEFKTLLEAKNLSVTVREEKGTDIDAACGQLRQRLEC